MRTLIDMVGKKFGRLTVMGRAANDRFGKPRYFCNCDCGRKTVVSGKLMRAGKTQSCGCYRYDKLREAITKHGYAFTKTYQVWSRMHERCTNQRSAAFRYYGGRGIKVCERWKSFENFLADMGHRPKGKSIDRINVNGNYEPNNCRWASTLEQANNKRMNVMVTHDGVTHTIADWSRKLGIPRTTLYMRYMKHWPTEKLLNTPKQVPRVFMYAGKKRTLPEISQLCGVSYITLAWRIRKGMPLAMAVVNTH